MRRAARGLMVMVDVSVILGVANLLHWNIGWRRRLSIEDGRKTGASSPCQSRRQSGSMPVLAPYAVEPRSSRGRLIARAAVRYALPLCARPRPHPACDRLPPAELQDPGLHLSRRRSLPLAPDPQPRSGADRPRARPHASRRRGPDRGVWRWPTISAIRRSAMPASARSTPPWRTPAASTTTRSRCASSPSWKRNMRASTDSISPGRRWRAWSSITAR